MNTKFRILWFEDEVVWYNMEKIRINDILDRHFLTAEFVRKDAGDFVVSELTGNSFDLILMDYNLADGDSGDNIISSIRRNNVLTDILFYSSRFQDMLAAVVDAIPLLDGVYLSERGFEEFTEKVSNLITKIVRRSEDIVNLRGFVMDGSCDFEVRVLNILNKAWDKFKEEERNILEESTIKNIEGIDKQQRKTREKVISQSPMYPTAISIPYFFCHSDRLYLLTKVISILQEKYNLRRDEVLDNFKVKYEDEISCYRNALGHRKATDTHIEVRRGYQVPIDEALHQLMRRKLGQYNSVISELEIFIDAIG